MSAMARKTGTGRSWRIAVTDPDYPPLLRTLGDAAPPLLHLRGLETLRASARRATAAELLRSAAVAIVGSRKSSGYGELVAGDFGHDLAALGVTIISGLAAGVDAAAHWGALDACGPTIAIIGCGIDVVYPSANAPLYREIYRRGLVVTEFPPGTQPLPRNFPARNRIISALSQAVVVVEGGYDSGALITARCALEQGRSVLAVPGNINCPTSLGPHALIRDGAAAATRAQDIVEEAGLSDRDLIAQLPEPFRSDLAGPGGANQGTSSAGSPTCALSELDERVLQAVPWTPAFIDHVIDGSGLTPQQTMTALLRLELAGLVTRDHGSAYFRLK